uniref:Xylanase inhibitor N-terminal domain-containing protein n=1 Tax=Chenopodium quinoa TaxID=63459 RepID=A0A803NDF0_CHEQI
MFMSMASSKLLFACFALFLSLSTVSVTSQQLLPLTHSLSKTQFSSAHHLLKSTATISAARHRRHTNKNRNHHQQVSLPLTPGSDYTLTFTLKSQTLSVYMDTGSDMCPLDEIEISDCSKYSCPSFYYAYGDGSLIAELHSENILMPSTSNNKPLNLKNFTFGCAHSTLGEPIGVAGFGRGSLSLPAQLANLSPDLGNQFSYCLVSHSFDSTKLRHPSPLILGKYKETEIDQYVYTPMLENPKHPYFYSVGLEAISVGSRRIEAPENLRRVDIQGNGELWWIVGPRTPCCQASCTRRWQQNWNGEQERELGVGGSDSVVDVAFREEFECGAPKKNYFHEFMDGGDEKKNKK